MGESGDCLASYMLMTWWMGCGWNMCQKFKYLECVLDESGIYSTEWCKKVVSRRKVVGTIRSLVNARNLQLRVWKGA